MIYDRLEDFTLTLPTYGALLGLDLGTKTIGIAASDTMRSVASPIETIRRKKFGVDAAQLLDIATKRSIAGLILGLPKNMDGSEGPRCQATRAFAKNLTGLTELPITFWDERLSTVAAEKSMIEADLSRKRRSEIIDQVAASYILQGALDRLQRIKNE